MRAIPWILLALLLSACERAQTPATAPQPAAPAPSTDTAATALVRIMPLGDSITQGDSDHNTYRRPLWKSLRAEGYNVDFVGSLRVNHRGPPPNDDFDHDHEGHWGWRVDEILDDIHRWAEEYQPDVVLVHLGSNDVFQRQSLDSTLDELGELIDAVREAQPQATLLLAQILPTDSSAANTRIRNLNARIPELAAAKSTATSRVLVVDHFTGFDPASQTYDGVHPNADGDIHLSDRWLESLLLVLSP